MRAVRKVLLRGLLPGVALALSGCGGSPAPQASDQPPVTVINGQLVTPGGPGTVRLPGLDTVRAAVDQGGTFTLALPGEAALAGQLTAVGDVLGGLGCSGPLTSRGAAVRGTLVGGLIAQDATGTRPVSAAQGTRTGPLSRGVEVRAWLYADAPTELRGTVDCARLLGLPGVAALPVTVAVNAARGWNVVDLSIGASANLLGQVSAAGSVSNSAAGVATTTWRTPAELQAQIGF